MRVIYSMLALWQVRLARWDLHRSDMLLYHSEMAFARSRWRVDLANDFARRAGFKEAGG